MAGFTYVICILLVIAASWAHYLPVKQEKQNFKPQLQLTLYVFVEAYDDEFVT